MPRLATTVRAISLTWMATFPLLRQFLVTLPRVLYGEQALIRLKRIRGLERSLASLFRGLLLHIFPFETIFLWDILDFFFFFIESPFSLVLAKSCNWPLLIFLSP